MSPAAAIGPVRQATLAALLAALLVACGSGEDPGPVSIASQSDATSVAADDSSDDDAQEQNDRPDGDETEGDAGLFMQFRGELLLASPLSRSWSCEISGDTISFAFVDGDGNDVSVSHDPAAATDAPLSLEDGSTWNRTEGGKVEVIQQTAATWRLDIEMTDVESGETQLLDARLSCD